MGKFRMWCLEKDVLVEAEVDDRFIGGLYYCPYCGPLNSKTIADNHVLEPSQPLLERLERTTQERLDELYAVWADDYAY